MHYHIIIINALNYLQDNYTTILTYLGAGGGISAVIQVLKKTRKWDSSTLIQAVLGVFTLLASSADYIINNQTSGAVPTIFGDMTPKLVVAALLMHRIAISPLSKFIEKQVQAMVSRAAVKAANSVTVTGNITPHVTAVDPIGAGAVPDDGVQPML